MYHRLENLIHSKSLQDSRGFARGLVGTQRVSKIFAALLGDSRELKEELHDIRGFARGLAGTQRGLRDSRGFARKSKGDSMISAALLENPKGTRGLPRLC